MTTVRLATIGVRRFACGPVDVTEAWTPVEVTGEVRAALVAYVGRILRVHPHDEDKLGALGLVLEHGRLAEGSPAELARKRPR